MSSPAPRPRAPRALPSLALLVLLVAPAFTGLAGLAGATHVAVPATCASQGNKADVVLVLDRSGSMTATDGNPNTRMQDAKNAANAFLGTLQVNDQSGLVSFSTGWTLDKSLSFNHAATQTAVNAQVASGFTSLWAGIRLGSYELLNRVDPPHSNVAARLNTPGVRQVLVVLTDGAQTDSLGFVQSPPGSPDPALEAQYAKNNGVIVFTIALGNDPALLPWYPTLQNIASSPQHFFIASSGANLSGVFSQISQRLRDAAPPAVGISVPANGALYFSGVASASPSPFGTEPAVRRFVDVRGTGSDDCQLVSVRWQVDEHADGVYVRTLNLPATNNHTAPFLARLDCDVLSAGRHLLRATARDFVDKVTTTERWFWCLKPGVASTATAAYARVGNPVAASFESETAALPTPLGGADRRVTANLNQSTPVSLEASLLWDDVAGSASYSGLQASTAQASALSRVLNASAMALPALPFTRLDAVEARVNVSIVSDGALTRTASGTSRFLETSGSQQHSAGAVACDAATALGQPCDQAALALGAQPGFCTPPQQVGRVTVEQCVDQVVVNGALTVLFNEQLLRQGPGFLELTVNAVHVLHESESQRSELILGQAYGGASHIGGSVLAGPLRSLDLPNDAGSGADASGALAAPLALTHTGVFQGAVADAADVDVYSFPVQPGHKLQVTVVPANGASAVVRSLTPPPPVPPTATPTTPAFELRLFAPDGTVRDSASAPDGAPTELELNVDLPGAWRWAVRAAGEAGAYTMVVSSVQVPLVTDDDALMQRDAAPDCASAMLVGPGVHVGTLDYLDFADAYRFQASEGQVIALVLRPGDTVEAADMALELYDRACNLLDQSQSNTPVKGLPEVVTYTVPTGATGLYRAVVRHVNGLGTYELAVAPVVATVG